MATATDTNKYTVPTLDAVNTELASRELREYIPQAWPIIEPQTPYLHNWHIDCISEYLQAVDEGQITRLLINIPPRYMKSITVSVMWPTWSWQKWPHTRWLFSSYSQDLSTDQSVKRRFILQSEWYQQRWGHKVKLATGHEVDGARGRSRMTEFENTARGVMSATSMSGTATGKGGDRVIIDDPHNPKQAESDQERITAIRNFDLTFSTRLNNKKTGAIVIIMQRLHVADLGGHVLDLGYDHLFLPGEAQKKTILILPSGESTERTNVVKMPSGQTIVRKPGSYLWPEREGKKEHDAMKRQLGSYGYAGQYDQTPNPNAGGKFQKQWFRYFTQNREFYHLRVPKGDGLGYTEKRVSKYKCWKFQTVDLAISEDEQACFTVIGDWIVTDESDLLLEHVERFRAEGPEVKQRLKASYARFKPAFQGIESAHYGTVVCQEWNRQGLPVVELKADKDKITRTMSVCIALENGRVYFAADAVWLRDYEAELTIFPVGPYNDQVDMTSYAGIVLAERAIAHAGEDVTDNSRDNQRQTESVMNLVDMPASRRMF